MRRRPRPRRASLAAALTASLAAFIGGTLCACATGARLVRAVPFWREGDLPDAERVNVWPLYSRAGDLVVVLWPIFDLDGRGFALRPLLAREEAEWSVLYPLAGWNAETGTWWLLPAYRLEENAGFFPLWNFGTSWNHVVLAWWVKDDAGEVSTWGLAPLFAVGEVHHAGPVWWRGGEDGEAEWGFFPLAYFGERSGYVVPAWWSEDGDGGLDRLGVFPLFYYDESEGYRRLITPLGGRSWGGDGGRRFVNVLGPVFHHSTDGERRYTTLAWPIFAVKRDPEQAEVRVFPVFRYADGEDRSSFSMLAGLIERARRDEHRSLRIAPLFTHNEGMPGSLWDLVTLYGYHEYTPDGDDAEEGPPHVSMHVGTPLLFNYRRRGDRKEWGSLLNVLDYESEGDESRFSLLYYLYRQHRRGDQVRRDFFPFFTWDSGPEKSGFSFLWRVFRWETAGDRARGHVLFIPWGDHGEPAAPRRT